MTNSFIKFRLLTLIIIILNLFPVFSYAQKKTRDSTSNLIQRPVWITNIDCNRTPTSNCNLIENYKFNTTCFGFDPFRTLCVNKWDYCFGSPQINAFSPLIAPTYNHASMWARSNLGMQDSAHGEGIVTAIPKLLVGNKYSFSLFKRAFKEPLAANTLKLDEFNIVLMKCADYDQMKLGNINFVPNIPSSAQVIYCEKNVNNANFQKISVSFTATSDYDVLWIFPKQWTWAADQWWLEVAKPELIDVTNFSAGISPNPIFPNCNVTVGPTTPNCSFEDAIFQWFGPNGQIIAAPANQQIQINASDASNVGTWTLKMIVPNVITTNNTCSSPGVVQASVNVPLCEPCPSNQVVRVADNASQLSALDIFPYFISQTKTNVICYRWEWDDRLKIKSTFQSGNTWYVNNIPVPNNYIGNQDEYLTLNNGFIPNGWNISPMEIKVSNPASCNGMSTPIYVVFNPLYLSEHSILSVHPNQNSVVNLFNYGSGSSYTWHNNYPGVTITPLNGNWSKVSIFVPFSYASSELNFPIDITNQWCSNTIYNNTSASCGNFCLNNFIGTISVAASKAPFSSNFALTQIYPNPATNQITISSTESINYIEISDLMNPVLKRIKASNTKSVTVNVSDLKSGIYNCKITTSKGIENQKLIIQR